MEIALQTIEYLGSEMDYVPWQAAQTELSYVRRMLVRTSLYGKYKVFIFIHFSVLSKHGRLKKENKYCKSVVFTLIY